MGSPERVANLAAESFLAERVESVFNACFTENCNTRLFGGADEPIYQPAVNSGEHHALYYRGDYFASALHEVAHWCIAGALRRQQIDFGYWYTPETRNIDQQRAFETVECKPQALEWFFSRACGYRFRVSADNLALDRAGVLDIVAFQQRVIEQAQQWQITGLPMRAGLFYEALCREFDTSQGASHLHFTLAELQ